MVGICGRSRMLMTPYHAVYFAHELTKRCSANNTERLANEVDVISKEYGRVNTDAEVFPTGDRDVRTRAPLWSRCGHPAHLVAAPWRCRPGERCEFRKSS